MIALRRLQIGLEKWMLRQIHVVLGSDNDKVRRVFSTA
jgi:hypothetical protein